MPAASSKRRYTDGRLNETLFTSRARIGLEEWRRDAATE